MNTTNTTNTMHTSPQGHATTLSPEDGVKALTGLWGTQFTLDDAALLGSGGADVAADLFGDLGTPTVATPEPTAEPVAALAKSTTDTESGNSASNSPIPKPRSQAHKASVSPTIRKKPLPRPHGVPSTAPRAATADLDLDSSDDELPAGIAGDCAWEDPDGAFASDDDSGGDLEAPTRPIKSRKAPVGKRIAPRSRSLARTLTPREKELQRQEREDARIQRDALRKEREHEEEYNRVSKESEARQSCRGKALDMLDGLIPLGLGATGKSTHFRRQNVATRTGAEPPVAVPDALDAQVSSYLNQPILGILTPEAERAPRVILHNRVLALQRATSAPGAIGVLEMRRTLKDPKWLPYERQRDMKNRVTTKGAESRKEHGRMLAIQAAEFDRVVSEKREARLKAAREAFSATECAVPTWTGTLPAHKGMAMTQSPLIAAC